MAVQNETIVVSAQQDNFHIERIIKEDISGAELTKIVEEIKKGLDAQIKQKDEVEKSIATLTERLSAFEKHLVKAKELEMRDARRPTGV